LQNYFPHEFGVGYKLSVTFFARPKESNQRNDAGIETHTLRLQRYSPLISAHKQPAWLESSYNGPKSKRTEILPAQTAVDSG
jgi:hypothetical protein